MRRLVWNRCGFQAYLLGRNVMITGEITRPSMLARQLRVLSTARSTASSHSLTPLLFDGGCSVMVPSGP